MAVIRSCRGESSTRACRFIFALNLVNTQLLLLVFLLQLLLLTFLFHLLLLQASLVVHTGKPLLPSVLPARLLLLQQSLVFFLLQMMSLLPLLLQQLLLLLLLLLLPR